MFERFWRADPSRVRTVGGSGLGLSISLEDARLHGGWLQVWRQPGQGAQFRLTLPLAAAGELTSSPLPLRPAVVRRHGLGPYPAVEEPVPVPEQADDDELDEDLDDELDDELDDDQQFDVIDWRGDRSRR